MGILDAEARTRLIRRGVRAVRNRAPGMDRWVRSMRAAVEQRYLRNGSAGAVVMDIGAFPYMGFGASIGWVHAGYLAARALSAPLYVTRPERWPFGGSERECALDRFIEFPLAQVVAPESVPADPVRIEAGNWDNLRAWGYFDDLDWPTCLFGHLPPQFADLEAFRRSVFAQTYRPTPYARERVAEMLDFMPARYLAWHVRRGDKTAGKWKEDHAVPLAEYVRATARAYELDPQAPRQVVICTDSEDVVAEARQALSVLPGVEVLHDDHEKRWDGYCALHRTGAISAVSDMVAEVLTAQKVTEILRGAHTLIGCNSSCLFRLAALLRPDDSRVTSLSENKAWKKYYPL